MKKTLVSLIVIGLLAIAAGPTLLSAAPLGPTFPYLFDFSESLKPWGVAGETGKLGDNALTLEAEDDSPEGLEVGNKFAAITMLGGVGGSGAIWALAAVPDTGNTINISFNARAVSKCARCVPIAYVGREIPTGIGDFQKVGGPLGEETGWSKRTLDVVLPLEQGESAGETPSGDIDPNPGPETRIVVAIGYMLLDSVKSTQRMGLDNIDIRVSGPGE